MVVEKPLSRVTTDTLSWLLHSSIEFPRCYFWVNEILMCILNGRNIFTLQGKQLNILFSWC
jgi:hypothetical protein